MTTRPPPSPPSYLLKQVFVSMAAIIADLGKVEAESPDMVEEKGSGQDERVRDG